MASTLHIDRYRHIVVLTGAGISVASGLRPFRGPGGLWNERDVAELATAQAFAERPSEVWRLFGELRQQAKAAAPNAAHLALTAAERRHPEIEFTIITQNVDGLHQRAGSKNVIELHGSIFRTRCSDSECALEPYTDQTVPDCDRVPLCPRCQSFLRPDLVLFEEAIPGEAEWHSKRAMRTCELFVAIGTSGTVWPASNLVRSAEFVGARTVLVNLEPMSPRHPAFDEEILGRAEELLPQLFS